MKYSLPILMFIFVYSTAVLFVSPDLSTSQEMFSLLFKLYDWKRILMQIKARWRFYQPHKRWRRVTRFDFRRQYYQFKYVFSIDSVSMFAVKYTNGEYLRSNDWVSVECVACFHLAVTFHPRVIQMLLFMHYVVYGQRNTPAILQ